MRLNIRNNSNDIKPVGAGLVPAQPKRNTGLKNTPNGITLVVLIITIIILLILATVSISLVINNNVLDHAQNGVDRYSEEEELEQIKLAVASAMLKGNGFLDTENLNSELRDKFGEEAEWSESSKIWSLDLDKNYKIYEDGNVEESQSILPLEYQQVEYIESSGTQFINTEVVPRSTTKVIFDFECTETGGGNGWGSAEGNESFLWQFSTSYISRVNTNWSPENTHIQVDFERHIFFLESGNQLFDGVKYGGTTIGNTASNKQYMYLCAEHWEWNNRQGNYSKRSWRILQGKNL